MKNVRFSRNGVEFEPTKQELKIVLDDYAKRLGERDKRIAELESELATQKERLKIALEDFVEMQEENDKLASQLAEKDKLIGVYDVEHSLLQREIADLVVKEIKAEDFAIEQLEKVKWLVEDIDYDFGDDNNISRDFVIKKINQQIKELKGKENV